MTMLACHRLKIRMGQRKLCSKLDLQLDPGQSWAVIGKNGAGKTTLLHTLAGLREPTEGDIFLQEKNIQTLGRKQIAQHLGLLLQDQQDPYSEMIRNLSAAFQAEQVSGNDRFAGDQYLETIEIAESIGPFADKFHAMGLMGLSRLYAQKGLQSEANRYARKASRLTSYAFILGE